MFGRFFPPLPSCTVDRIFLRYSGASAVALGADLGSFLLLLQLSMPALPSSVASFLLGILVHWLVSSRAVFGEALAAPGAARIRQQVLFVAAALVGLALTGAIVGTSATYGIDLRVAKLVAVAASFVATWGLRRRLVFA